MSETERDDKVLSRPELDGAAHIKRYEALKALRAPYEQYWRDAYAYTYPLRGAKLTAQGGTGATATAETQTSQIYDTTATESVRLLASALVAGQTPENSRWFSLDVPGIEDDTAVDKWLDAAATRVWQNIHASRFGMSVFEATIDLAIAGMFALYTEAGKKDSGQPYSFKLWPLHSIVCADSTGKGVIDTVYRSFSLTAEQAVNEYGGEVSDAIKRAVEKKPDTPFDFIQAIYPRCSCAVAEELPIASVHIEVKGKRVVRESGYHEMPVAVPRWLVLPDSVYSIGPVNDALPDIKTLNETVKLILSNADLAIAGMWGAVDDGVLNPKTVKIGPRKIVVVANKDSFFPLNSGTKFDVGQIEVERLQRAIRKILLSDQLQPQNGPAMTATEVHVRTQLIRQLLSPMFGRLQPEFLEPLIARCLGISQRAGELDKMPEALVNLGPNAMTSVRYSSPLARAQRLEDVGAMDRFEQGLLTNAQAGMTAPMDVYDFDEAARERAELLGVPAKLLRDEKVVKKVRDDRAVALQKQKAEEQKAEIAKAIVPKAMEGARPNAA